MDNNEFLAIETHERIGRRLKYCADSFEQIRAALIQTYPKSSRKEQKQLETLLNVTLHLQTNLHRRLIAENSDKPDSELLPIYLGRLPQ